MLIQWNAQSAAWFDNASRYTKFHEKLAAYLLPHIHARNSLIDLGCGVGLIDFSLAHAISHITCVDHNEDALFYLRRFQKERGIANITVQHGDACEVTGQWDTALSVFFKLTEETVPSLLRLCNESMIAIVHTDAHGFENHAVSAHQKCDGVTRVQQMLDSMHVQYTCMQNALEYGQPFVSMDDAAAFVQAYRKNPPNLSIEAYLEKNLIQTGQSPFPYYLPNLKSFGIFIIRREENAHI